MFMKQVSGKAWLQSSVVGQELNQPEGGYALAIMMATRYHLDGSTS